MIEYLVRLLQDEAELSVLSRGYGRKTKGFLLAEPGTDARQIGDEPYQLFNKFKKIRVVVDENRVRGVNQLLELENPPEIVLLDDAFQHRRIQAGLYVLITSCDKPYFRDWLLPTGDLREPRSSASRADIIIVSKCPENLVQEEKKNILRGLRANKGQDVFFTGISYGDSVIGEKDVIELKELPSYGVILVTGIANPVPLTDHLAQRQIRFEHFRFPDHHELSSDERARINSAFEQLQGQKKLVLTTEKDFVRNFENSELPVYYLPIQTRFLEGEERFKQKIINYVRKD